MTLEKEKVTEALKRYYRKHYCFDCPDFWSGEPRLKVRSDCFCITLKKQIEEEANMIIKAMKYYEVQK
jgi:hypothetical protein